MSLVIAFLVCNYGHFELSNLVQKCIEPIARRKELPTDFFPCKRCPHLQHYSIIFFCLKYEKRIEWVSK